MTIKKITIILIYILSFISVFAQTKSDQNELLRTIPVSVDSADMELFEKAGIRKKTVQAFTLADYRQAAEKILQHLENHGFPFAQVYLKTTLTDDSTAYYLMKIDRNNFTRIDSIVMKGSAKIRPSFLWPYLGLKRKQAYSEKTVREIEERVLALPFVKVLQPSGVSFEENRTLIYLYLDKRQTNRFDGYVGFEPQNTATGRFSITGEANLALRNLFKMGESFTLSWHSSERFSQYLDINIQFPYLFYTSFGVSGAFALDKHDTTFMTLHYNVGIPYHFPNHCYIEPFFDYTQSQPLGNKSITESDLTIDNYKTLFGLSLKHTRLDNLYNPRKGVDLDFSVAVGNRVVRKNPVFDENVYKNVVLRSKSYNICGGVSVYIPLFKRLTLALRGGGGSLIGSGAAESELYKLGGEKLIRGFTQNELLASTFLLYSAEIRYLFNRNSDFHLFFDGGAYEKNTTSGYQFDTPFGFGLGVNIGVRSGIFYFEYALPRQHDNKISFKSGKIHFGVKALF